MHAYSVSRMSHTGSGEHRLADATHALTRNTRLRRRHSGRAGTFPRQQRVQQLILGISTFKKLMIKKINFVIIFISLNLFNLAYSANIKVIATVDGEIPLELMEAIPADSIDYAVMEQSDKVKVVPSEFHWTDLGSFDALVTYGLEHPEQDIVQVVDGCEQVYAIADQPVFASGLKNTIIVQTSDATLMLPLNESSRVKAVYNKVKAEQSDLTK